MVASATVWLKNPVGCTTQPTATAAVTRTRAQQKEQEPRIRNARNSTIFEDNRPSSIFTPEDGRTPPSSMFGFEERRTPHLQSSISGSKERGTHPSSIFGLEDWRSFEDGGRVFFEDRGFFVLLAPKNEKPPMFDLRSRMKEESSHLPLLLEGRRILSFSSSSGFPSTNPGQVFWASDARSSNQPSGSKVRPKIEIGPLLRVSAWGPDAAAARLAGAVF